MKKFKKLIPALCMLLVSAVMLGSTTFAWFSMNKTVTATAMTVEAKSNSTYLLIGATDNKTTKTDSDLSKVAAFVSGGTNKAAGEGVAANTDKKVYPAYYAAANGTMPGTAAGGTGLTVEKGKWYTANNKNSNNATDATINFHVIDNDKLVNHVCTYNTWLTLSEDSEDYTGKINIKSTLVSGDAAASIVVVLEQGSNTDTLKLTHGAATDTTVDFTITATTSVKVTYYIYIDGTSTNVNSDYINTPHTLSGDISVEFTIA